MILDGETVAIIGAITAPLITVIGVLWAQLKSLQTDFNAYRNTSTDNFNKYRDDFQKQYMDMLRSQVELTTKTALQIEGYNKTIETLVNAFATFKDMMGAIRDEFIKTKKDV